MTQTRHSLHRTSTIWGPPEATGDPAEASPGRQGGPLTVRQTIRQAIRSGLTVAVICAAAVAAPSTAAHPTAALPTAGERGSQPVPTKNTVTAAQLGADSVVAVVTHGPFDDVEADGLARSLEVITPDGVPHPVYTV